ncbi:MAG: winged helix-turn-helix transcriptional regulator [Euryarchaeota archaeon]|nr:winged helix-turn-helix transcriptional regulator [Euryarchaeota archaeon]
MKPDEFSRAEAGLFRALGDETRVAILGALRGGGPLSVGDIRVAVGRELTLVSHHLSCLRNCGLVTTERRGKSVLYSLNGHRRIEQMLALAGEHVEEAHRKILECRVAIPGGRGPRRR